MHNFELIESKCGPECSLVHTFSINSYMMKVTLKVNVTQNSRSLQSINQYVGYTWNEKSIFKGDLIQGSIIDAHLLGSILLLHKQHA